MEAFRRDSKTSLAEFADEVTHLNSLTYPTTLVVTLGVVLREGDFLMSRHAIAATEGFNNGQ